VPDDDAVRLQAALTRLLRWATRPGSIEDRAGPAAAGLTPTDLWLLDGVTRYGPVRSSDLAAWQGVDRSTITVQLRRLEERGLVVRTPDPDDGRVVQLTVSATGQELWDAVDGHGAQVVAGMTAGWRATDRARLAELFDRFTAGMDSEPPRH
jgi:DNA-binding MarR family transcriptional regulator